METHTYFTISVLNLYKGCHKDKSFEDAKKFRQYMKKQAQKGHTDIMSASMSYKYDDYYNHTMWTIIMG